ncbi:MAG: F0F1 ATP synthase subunit B [Zetaproteobacteria bacterium]|nr:MAG: F0F1 ATP synthase subunit B [Zetaproteobacteria bacterium]
MSIDLTFIGQIVVFLTLVWLMKKHLYGPLNEMMEERARKIAEGLAAAEAGQEQRKKAEAEVERQLAKARAEAQAILSRAESRAAEINEEAVHKARSDAEQILAAAREEIAAETERARQALRGEVASIAMAAAEQIIQAELDAKRHTALIESIIEREYGKA